MFKLFTVLTVVGCVLCGCQSVAERRSAEGDELARALGDYIVFRQELPGDIASLRSFAAQGSYHVPWSSVREAAFLPISSYGIRVDFVDASGVADYRVIFILARDLEPFLHGPCTNASSVFLTDPKAKWMFYH